MAILSWNSQSYLKMPTVNQLNSLAGQSTKTMKTSPPALPVNILPIYYPWSCTQNCYHFLISPFPHFSFLHFPFLLLGQPSLDWTGLDWTGLDWTDQNSYLHTQRTPPRLQLVSSSASKLLPSLLRHRLLDFCEVKGHKHI